MSRIYRAYSATLLGDYLDIRGRQYNRPEAYDPDRYDRSQLFGETIRASGGLGILYDSLRRRRGSNVVAFRPRSIVDIGEGETFEISVSASRRSIDVRRLGGVV